MRSSWARSNRGACRSSSCSRRHRGHPRGEETTMKLLMLVLLVACVAVSIPASAQGQAPALNFDAANALTLPDDIYLGEVGGVATNSRGDIYVYTRTGHPTVSMATARPFAHGGSRLFQFDRSGKFTRE